MLEFFTRPRSILSIDTDSKYISFYIDQLFKRIEGHEAEFIENLCNPLQRNPLEILMHLQNVYYEIEEDNAQYHQSVMTVDIYLEIEWARKRQQESERDTKETEFNAWKQESEQKGEPWTKEPEEDGILSPQMLNLRCEWENIHNKVVFDAVNEALDGYRPYGLKGPPLPWSRQTRALTNKN